MYPLLPPKIDAFDATTEGHGFWSSGLGVLLSALGIILALALIFDAALPADELAGAAEDRQISVHERN